jgi:hypothetical protein
MGLTHSWERSTELAKESLARAITDCRRATQAAGVPLAGRDGTGQPIFDSDKVIFNGQLPASCEPFEIHQTEFDRRGKNRFFQFAKTNHAPYDLSIRVALICLKHHLGDSLRVMSDAKDPDWDDARQICQEALGYGTDFKLDE